MLPSPRSIRGWGKLGGGELDQPSEFFNRHSQVFDNASQRLSLNGNTTVHGNYDSRVVSGTNIDGMAPALSPELKSQPLGNVGHLFARNDG